MSEETWSAVDAYFEARLIETDPALDAALKASTAAGLPPIHVFASQGKFLQILALAQAPRRILEVGTLGGYGALWLVRALGTDGRLVTLEVEPRHAAVARENFTRAGVAQRIDLHVGPAIVMKPTQALSDSRRRGQRTTGIPNGRGRRIGIGRIFLATRYSHDGFLKLTRRATLSA
jgi:predicted O-methyltransferase YrrM